MTEKTTADIDWIEVEADDVLEEFPGTSPDRLAREIEDAADAYDGGYETTLLVAAALRRRSLAWTNGKVDAAKARFTPVKPPLAPAKRPRTRAPADVAPGLFDLP